MIATNPPHGRAALVACGHVRRCAWSLCVEEHFYLLFPIVLYPRYANDLQRRGIYVLLGLIALGVVLRYVSWVEFVDDLSGRRRLGAALTYIYYPTYTRLDGLIFGIGIASLSRFAPALWTRVVRHGNALVVAGIAVLTGCYLLFDGLILSQRFSSMATTVIGFPAVAFGYGLITIAALSPNCMLYRVRFKPTATLATLAFAIYLTHKMTNHLINTKIAFQYDLSVGQTFLACLATAVLAGVALHVVVERPFLKLRAYLLRDPR